VSSPAYPDCNTLADVLQQVAERQGARPALVDRGRTFTFAELERDVEALAASLHQHGVDGGATCALLMDNVYEHVVAWFAIQRAGLTLVPVNVTLAAPEIAHQLRDSQATAVVVSPGLVPKLLPSPAAVTPGPPGIDVAIVLDSWQQEPSPPVVLPAPNSVHQIDLPSLPTRDHRAPVARSDTAVVWYTSGTTGHPKGAVHTHDSSLNAVAAWIAEWDWTPEDRGLIRNLYHVGMMATVASLLLAGASLAFSGPFSIESYLTAAQDNRVTILRTSQVMLALIDKRPELLDRIDLSSVRRVGVGGAIDRDVLLRSIDRFPGRVWDYSWSQSELNSGGTNVDGDEWFSRLGSCGRPIACIESMTIRDADGNAMATGAVGEVCVRSSSEMVGYLNAPEATSEIKRGGWLHTGDLGYLDADGYLYLVARQREVIIRGGENIYPAEIEQVIASHAAVEECVAVGIPDSVMGEVPVAFVVLRPAMSAAVAELGDLAEARLARYKRPVHIEVVTEIPRNALGKIQRTRLSETGSKHSR
jgi:acyl-CoA synthetase (AMP-forming)/AMP-acid ligase II